MKSEICFKKSFILFNGVCYTFVTHCVVFFYYQQSKGLTEDPSGNDVQIR